MEPNRPKPTDPVQPPEPQTYQPQSLPNSGVQPVAPAPPPQQSSPTQTNASAQINSSPNESENENSSLQSIAASFLGLIGGLFSWVIFPVIIVLILHNFVFQAYHVLGTSMLPTLHQSDYLIVSKVGDTEAMIEQWFGKKTPYIPARGQILVFHYPDDTTKVFVKRVVGLPGDHIVIKNGTVTIYNAAHPNGFNPDASYEPAGTQTLIDTDEIVQPGSLFMMGDNRTPGGSFDSREWGQLRSSYIIGNAVLRLLPLGDARVF